ncbi:hypothetical protein RXV95_11305 [Novosphingobium sp. ZN18A2]|uniref:hypothetical protein n=1 Tax=Novosphingobium sp. ZN18A2 TaxID=3079861 RepID=UPI0030D249F4
MKYSASMKYGVAAALLAASAITISSPAVAQRGGGGGGGGGGMPSGQAMPPMTGQGTLDRMRDQDRLRDPSSDQDRDQDRLRDRDQTQTPDQLRDRDRDRIHVDQVVEGQIASWQLLDDGERMQFHNRMMQAKSQEERNRIRTEYQQTIRQRAGDLGVDAPFGPQRSGSGMRDGYYLAQMLTEQERAQFHQRMRQAGSAEERNRIRTEMQTTARERAREMGIDVPAWFGSGQGN